MTDTKNEKKALKVADVNGILAQAGRDVVPDKDSKGRKLDWLAKHTVARQREDRRGVELYISGWQNAMKTAQKAHAILVGMRVFGLPHRALDWLVEAQKSGEYEVYYGRLSVTRIEANHCWLAPDGTMSCSGGDSLLYISGDVGMVVRLGRLLFYALLCATHAGKSARVYGLVHRQYHGDGCYETYWRWDSHDPRDLFTYYSHDGFDWTVDVIPSDAEDQDASLLLIRDLMFHNEQLLVQIRNIPKSSARVCVKTALMHHDSDLDRSMAWHKLQTEVRDPELIQHLLMMRLFNHFYERNDCLEGTKELIDQFSPQSIVEI